MRMHSLVFQSWRVVGVVVALSLACKGGGLEAGGDVVTVAVSPSSLNLVVGQTEKLTATPRDAAGTPVPGRAVTWTTDASGVATVDLDGLVKGEGEGPATITATSEGKSGTATVTVTAVTTGHPFEPAGAIALLDWVTDLGALGNCVFCGNDAYKPWTYISGASNLETVTDGSAPVDGSRVGRVRMSPGCCAGGGPAQLQNEGGARGGAAGYGIPPTNWEQWYIATWFKLVNYDPRGDDIQKVWSLVTSTAGGNIESMHVEITGTSYPLTLGVTMQLASVTTANIGSFDVYPDTWYEVIELYTKSTGRYQQWVRPQGGAPVLNVDRTQTMRWSNEFLRWWWGHGGLGAYAGSTPGYFYHNRVYMSYR